MRLLPRLFRHPRPGLPGGSSLCPSREGNHGACRQESCYYAATSSTVETRLLILNADPVFQDRSLAIFDMLEGVEVRIARTLAEAISILIEENFDGFVVEGETAIATAQA